MVHTMDVFTEAVAKLEGFVQKAGWDYTKYRNYDHGPSFILMSPNFRPTLRGASFVSKKWSMRFCGSTLPRPLRSLFRKSIGEATGRVG